MQKFEIGDKVKSINSAYHYTCKDSIILVTNTNDSTFSGIISWHPTNPALCTDRVYPNLSYNAFIPYTGAPIPSKRFNALEMLTINGSCHLDSETCTYENEQARLISYEGYDEDEAEWTVTIMLPSGSLCTAWESELNRPSTLTSLREDIKKVNGFKEQIIIQPVYSEMHIGKKCDEKSEVIPIKEQLIYTPSYENVLDKYATKKRGHISLKFD